MSQQVASCLRQCQSRLVHSLTAARPRQKSWRDTGAPGLLQSLTGRSRQGQRTTEELSLKGRLLMRLWGSKRQQGAKKMEEGHR